MLRCVPELPADVMWMPTFCLAPNVMLMSLACDAREGYDGVCVAEDHVDVCGMYFHWRPCWDSRHMQMLGTVWMSLAHAIARNQVEVHDSCYC